MYTADTKTWYLERWIRLVAGIFVLGSTLLGFFVNYNWFMFTGFVGAMPAPGVYECSRANAGCS